MASPVGTSFLDHFAALRDPRQGWKVVFPLSDDEAPRLEAPAEIDITTVILARKQPVGLGPATCVASEPETWTAFAILSGISSEALGTLPASATVTARLPASPPSFSASLTADPEYAVRSAVRWGILPAATCSS